MELLQVTVKNFLSYGDEEQVLALDKLGLVLLTGENEDTSALSANGTGKSSILEAIIYAMYGQTSTGVKGDEIINNKAQKNLKVTLTLKKGKDTYRIERYRKDKTYKNKTLLFLNDKEITSKSIKDTNQDIATLIGIDFNTYIHSYMQGLGGQGSFIDSTDKEKKEILENIADLSVYPKAQTEAKEEYKECLDKIEKVASEINANNYSSQAIKDAHEASKRQAEQNKSMYASAKQEEEQLVKAILPEEEIDKLRKEYSNTLTKMNEIQNSINSSDKVNKQIQSLSSAIQQKEYDIQYKSKALEDYKANLSDLKSKYQQLKNNTANTCFYCGQELDKEHKEQEMARLKQQGVEVVNSFKAKQEEVNNLQVDLDNAKQSYEEAKGGYVDLTDLYNQQRELDKACSEINTKAENNKANKSRLEAVRERLSNFGTITPEDDENSLESKLEALESDLKKLTKKQTKLDKEKKILEDTIELYSDRGAKSLVMDLILPYLNQKTNEYLRILTDGSIQVFISSTSTAKNGNISDRISVDVNNLNGGDNYNFNSRGERQRISIAISLALQSYCMSTASKMNLMCFDELFDSGMDDTGANRVAQMLREMTKEFPSIIVVSHNKDLQEYFDRVLTVTKKDGISKLTLD